MKTFLVAIALFAASAFPVLAITPVADDHTAREEAEGKGLWEQLQKKEISCDNLTEDNFGALGEYFMGTMLGSAHEQMNARMTTMMGKEGEEQMHVAMGKRMSGCDTNAALPAGMMNSGMMPMMMGMMGGGMMGNGISNMPNANMPAPYQRAAFGAGMGSFGFPFMAGWGWFGPMLMLAFWALVIWGIIALIRGKGGHSCCHGDHEHKDKKDEHHSSRH